MKSFYVIILSIIIISFNIKSQDFGEIPDELLKMTSLAEDPEEDAAVIFDKGTVRINSNFDLEQTRHVRVKVFTEEGKKQANIKIVIWHEDDINGIDAIAISPDGKEYELDSDNIFVEEGERTTTISFPVPGVEVGTVFDYKYRIYSEYISRLEPWSFQSDIYTKYSEVKVFLPAGFTYNRLVINHNHYEIQENYEEVLDRENVGKKNALYTWSCSNLPGVKDEPFTDNIDDNYLRLYFILVAFRDEYVSLKFAKDWDFVAKEIYKYYDDLIDDNATKEKVDEIIGAEINPFKKANLIYDYIRTNIKSTEHKALLGEFFKEPEKVLIDKTGSTSEKSMLLINMLTQAGLNAKPVWVSTRGNGTIIPDFCDRSQFNRLICLLQIDKQQYFLYPSSSFVPFGYFTSNIEVSQGLLIEEEKGSIIALKPQSFQNSIIINTNGKIDVEKNFTAQTHIVYTGQSAIDERDALQLKDSETYIKDYMKEKFPEAKLDTFYYTNTDSAYLPLQLDLKFTIQNYVEETDPLGYFSLPFFSGVKENPFKSAKRTNPIDFKYPELKSETIKIELPENYLISQIPNKKKKLITSAGFSQVHVYKDNTVECNRTIDLSRRRLELKSYKDVKSFFDELVTSNLEQVVFTKKVTGN